MASCAYVFVSLPDCTSRARGEVQSGNETTYVLSLLVGLYVPVGSAQLGVWRYAPPGNLEPLRHSLVTSYTSSAFDIKFLASHSTIFCSAQHNGDHIMQYMFVSFQVGYLFLSWTYIQTDIKVSLYLSVGRALF